MNLLPTPPPGELVRRLSASCCAVADCAERMERAACRREAALVSGEELHGAAQHLNYSPALDTTHSPLFILGMRGGWPTAGQHIRA